jgi:ubiquinone/menaquinone biosynthesis C-methylase UbiE
MFRDYPNVANIDIDFHAGINNFCQANAENLPFKNKSFQYAVLGEILEHVENPKQAISEAVRVANKVILTVPFEYEWNHPYVVAFDTLKQEESDRNKSRQEIYKDTDKVKFFKGDNYEHLRHRRFYTYESLDKELNFLKCKYSIVLLRQSGISHFGVVIDADSMA